MGSTTLCNEHQHNKFHHSHQLYLNKKSLREIDIPPRKLLSRGPDMFHSPTKVEDALLSKFLPCNSVEDDSDDPYSSDHFRMYEFKVRKCNRSRSHDWMDCPFAHPGEKARRRDPRRYHYSGTVCSEFRKGHCGKGDNCEFSHGVFECWLHPTRYRTEACKDGKNCKRKVCFFAHSSRQLRMLPDPSSPLLLSSPAVEKLYRNLNNCCAFCHASPTSTLLGTSHLSPPLSPMNTPEFSRLSSMDSCGMYKDDLTELMASLSVNEPQICHRNRNVNLPWIDVTNFNIDEQSQFVLSPSSPSPAGSGQFFAGENRFFPGRYNRHESNVSGPDLGWVNDLLT